MKRDGGKVIRRATVWRGSVTKLKLSHSISVFSLSLSLSDKCKL